MESRQTLRDILREKGLVLASSNSGKIRELSRLLEKHHIRLFSPDDFDLKLEVAETEATYSGNASLKALAFYKKLGRPVIADDSGLSVSILNGRPGVLSARYGDPDWSDRERRMLLLRELEGIPEEKRAGRFDCVLALSLDGNKGNLMFFKGEVTGFILSAEKGSGGFGYDPIFREKNSKLSFAQLSPSEKDKISHRGRAIKSFLEALLF